MESVVTDKIISACDEKHITPPFIALVKDVSEALNRFSPLLPPGARLALVCDRNTRAALGNALLKYLPEATCIELPGVPVPDMETIALIREHSRPCDAVVAVGSGTINDLCKYATVLDNKPYVVFPTAPSMNGYASANASIIHQGKKQTVAAHLPLGILCITEVLTAAPIRLIRAGLGDSLARSTAQADWLLSHLVRGTLYDSRPFEWLVEDERALLAQTQALTKGDHEAVATLMRILLRSGLGMTLSGGSYPASQGEHMIVHAYEMLFGGGDVLHGEAVGVTTLYMARLQEVLLSRHGNPSIDNWPEIAARIRPITLSPSVIEQALHAVDAPTAPQELGWSQKQFEEAVIAAPRYRDRFTFLNLQV